MFVYTCLCVCVCMLKDQVKRIYSFQILILTVSFILEKEATWYHGKS